MMRFKVLAGFLAVLLVAPSSASPLAVQRLGDSDDLAELHLPKRSYDPTPEQREQDVQQYRVAPNQGFKISEQGRNTQRRPTQQEATTAVGRSVEWHQANKALLDTLTTGNTKGEYKELPINSTENEELAAAWEQSGADRAKRVAQEKHPAMMQDESGPVETSVYDAPDDRIQGAHFPREESIEVQDLTGEDKMVQMPAAVHPPEFNDCLTEPTYSEHVKTDTLPIMTDEESIHPSRVGNATERQTSQCRIKCNQAEQCLGYVETFSHSQCWTIPQSKFPNGKVVQQPWGEGSLFVKRPPAPAPADCGLPADARVLPARDFGSPASPITSLTAQEEAGLKAHEAEFLSKELVGINTYPHQQHVTPERKQEAMNERKQKADEYYNERKAKILESHNLVLRTEAERRKKAAIKQELVADTESERDAKTRVLNRERGVKSAKAKTEQAAAEKEVAFKKTPEGEAQDVEEKARLEAAHVEQEAEHARLEAEQRAERATAIEKEKARLADVADEVTQSKDIIDKYNNETAANGGNGTDILPGSDVYKAMMFLEKEGVPY